MQTNLSASMPDKRATEDHVYRFYVAHDVREGDMLHRRVPLSPRVERLEDAEAALLELQGEYPNAEVVQCMTPARFWREDLPYFVREEQLERSGRASD